MRVQLTLTAAALVSFAALPAAAQEQAAQNQTVPAKAAKTPKAAKPAEKKVCRDLTQGRVCMTPEKWEEYDSMM